MSGVLSTEIEVLALSPDASSAKAAKGLTSKSKWPTLGSNNLAVWGECQGSGSRPYQTQVDLSGPTFKCSCPSRKFPCKHGLGLLLMRSQGMVDDGQDLPSWVQSWVDGRKDKAEKKEAKLAAAAAAPAATPDELTNPQSKRWSRIEEGSEDLSLWFQDMVSGGLAMLSKSDAKTSEQWTTMKARVVDMQAPALALRIEHGFSLIQSKPDWAHLLLNELGQMQMLCDAVKCRAQLTSEERFDLMMALGFNFTKLEICGLSEPVEDIWQVVGSRTIERDGSLIERQTWLSGKNTGKLAWLLDFTHGSKAFDHHWIPGMRYKEALLFYPGSIQMRALRSSEGPLVLVDEFVSFEHMQSCLMYITHKYSSNPLHSASAFWANASEILKSGSTWYLKISNDEGNFDLVTLEVHESDAWDLMMGSDGLDFWIFGSLSQGVIKPLSAWIQGEDASMTCIWQQKVESR